MSNPAAIGKALPIHEGDPHAGYYRMKSLGGGWLPVAIWYEGDNLVATAGPRTVDPVDTWTWCCRHPISWETYTTVMDGGQWPDADPVVAAQIGDNSSAVSDIETLQDQIDAALKGTEAYKVIKDDETAAKALSLRNRLNELSGEADKKRDELKRPHLEAGKKIDKAWMPLVKKAKDGADDIRVRVSRWEDEKLKRQREAAKAAQEAMDRQDIGTTPAPVPQVETKRTVQTNYGRAASVSTKMVAVVSDYKALVDHYATHPKIYDLVEKLAQADVDLGKPVPGITVEEKAVVK